MSDINLEFLSIVSRIIVALPFVFLIFGTIKLMIRNHHSKRSPDLGTINENPINFILLIGCYTFLLFISQIKLTYLYDGSLRQNVNILVVSICIALGITFLVSQIFKRVKSLQIHYLPLIGNSQKPALSTQKKQLLDRLRKANHLIAFAIALSGIFIGVLTVYVLVRYYTNHPEYDYFVEKLMNFWKRNDDTTFLENIFNQEIFATSRTICAITFGGLMVVLATIDYTRLSQKWFFPFQAIVNKQLHWEEKKAIGSYVYLTAGLAVSSVLLSTMFFLAVTSVVSFGDSAASIIGMKFGKRPYKHNNKTIEGTIAGVITSCLLVFFLIGPYYAVVAGILFGVIDIISPNPIKLNDNLILSLVLTGVFIVLYSIGIPSITILEYFV